MHVKISSAICFNLDQSKILPSGNGLNLYFVFNSLPSGKILEWSKLKAFAEDKITVAKTMIFVFDRVENIVEKEKCWFPLMFSNGF